MTKVNAIRKKNVLRYNNEPCLVLESTIRTPPNLTSFCQMTLRNLLHGKTVHVRCPVSDSYDVLNTNVRKVEFSYVNQDVYAFMDNESFETFELNRGNIEDILDYLVPGQLYELFEVDGRPLTVSAPSVVEMTVTEAAEALRGDSTGSVNKPVTTETGKIVMVPLFIKRDDRIRVNTEDGSYQGRV
jgi:elongation factor P